MIYMSSHSSHVRIQLLQEITKSFRGERTCLLLCDFIIIILVINTYKVCIISIFSFFCRYRNFQYRKCEFINIKKIEKKELNHCTTLSMYMYTCTCMYQRILFSKTVEQKLPRLEICFIHGFHPL